MSRTQYYELELKWLVLPNKTLMVAHGGTIDNYPYLYVLIYNDGEISTVNNLISNNPNSTLASFKVPVDKWLYDQPTSFFTLKPKQNKQIIRFSLDKDIRVTITTPDGTPLALSTPDNLSPLLPNPLLQVNLSLSIKPVNNNMMLTNSSIKNIDL